MNWLAAIAMIAGCRVADLDVSGKPCPCPSDYVCDVHTNTCAHSIAGDAHPPDVDLTDAALDGRSATSCLHVAPLTTLAYSTTNFADFATWTTKGSGIWAINSNGDAIQTDQGAQLALAQMVPPTSDYRLVSTFHATSTGAGKAIELAARSVVNLAVAPPIQHLYHCNWEPSDGAFMIQIDTSPTTGVTLGIVTVDTTTIPGYTESMPITMEFQVTGNSMACCIDNFPATAYVAVTDNNYAGGSVGMKTYEMTAVYDDFYLYK